MKHADKVKKPFEYANSEQTLAPGYLEGKFRALRRRLAAQRAAADRAATAVRAERDRVVRKLAKVA